MCVNDWGNEFSVEEVDFDVGDVDHVVGGQILGSGGGLGIAVSLDFVFGALAFFTVDDYLIDVVGKGNSALAIVTH